MRGKYDMVVVGASAGGVDVLLKLVHALPVGLPAPVLIVLHVGNDSKLAQVLASRARVRVSNAEDGEPIAPGRVYVAPPDRHMIVRDGVIGLSRDARENGHRPAIDPLFRSAAREHRSGVIGVVLSGQLDDGVAGLLAIKSRGGLTIAQDPETAIFPSMPASALQYVDVDCVLGADELGPTLVKLIQGDAMPRVQGDKPQTRKKTRPSRRMVSAARRIAARTENDTLVCPECSGPLQRVDEGELTQWKCAVGHTFSPESLTEAQTDALERVLWMAVRTLSERAQVQRQTTTRLQGRIRDRMQERAEATEQDVALIRSILDRL